MAGRGDLMSNAKGLSDKPEEGRARWPSDDGVHPWTQRLSMGVSFDLEVPTP